LGSEPALFFCKQLKTGAPQKKALKVKIEMGGRFIHLINNPPVLHKIAASAMAASPVL